MNKYKQIITVRVSDETIKELDALAKERNVSRALIIRNILGNANACQLFIESQWAERESSTVKLEYELAEELKKELPPEFLTVNGALALSQALRRISQDIKRKVAQ